MKKSLEVSARSVVLILIGWLLVTNLLAWLSHTVGWWPCKVLLFLCISFLPGVAILRSMRIALRLFSVGALYSFGLSILVLMLSGLAANEILYAFGMSRPLELIGILGTWDVITVLLIAVSTFMNRQPLRLNGWSRQGFSSHAWLLLALSALLPCLGAMGAFRLNNGGDALFAEITLGFAVILIMYVFLLRRRLPNDLLVWFIFVMGLTILLMTALRGWDIVGHDIEREFRVYTLTHLHGHWDIGLDRDPYNACLSITILPEVLARILNISGLVVFKVVLQIIFAACPAAIYVLLKQYAPKLGALVGSMLFIVYPTFVNDSAMLTRQGVAYLFFTLAILVISNKAQKKRYKLLFSLCALGAVLSHYSTAYMFVGLFSVAVVCKLCIGWWQGRHRKYLRPKPPRVHAQPSVLSITFAVLLALMTFGWYTQITGTSGGLIATITASVSNIPKLFSSDSASGIKSSDTSASLLFSGNKTQAGLYQSYLSGSQTAQSSSSPAKVSQAQDTSTLTGDDMPLTALGKKALSVGIDPGIVTALRQNFAKALQLLALVALSYTTYLLLRKKPDALGVDFVCLNLAGFMLLVLMVLLPVLSVSYGLLRAFQQILIFLVIPIMLLLVDIGSYLWTRLSVAIATLSTVLLFLLFTGFVAQMLGGSSPTLSLDNSGIYYGLYASSAADASSFVWIKAHIPKTGDVRAANFNRALMHDPKYPFSKAGILPSQTTSGSFIYADPAQVQTQKLYTYYQSSPLIVSFPLDYYDSTKNLIYSTSLTRVYR